MKSSKLRLTVSGQLALEVVDYGAGDRVLICEDQEYLTLAKEKLSAALKVVESKLSV